jgi:hypothetical protein
MSFYASFHHRKLPQYSTLLSGHTPPDGVGFRSERLQILYNHTVRDKVYRP